MGKMRLNRLLLCAGLCAALLLQGGCAGIPVMPVYAEVQRLPVILVDAGHGGADGGAVGPEGLLEKDLNLSVSLKLAEQLRFLGFDVLLTRQEDVMQGSKGEDTRFRAELAAGQGEDAIFVSIHQNKFPQTSSHGTQVFYGTRHPESARLAEGLQSEIVSMLQPENHRQCQPGNDGIYLLTHLPCRAVLVECGFLSNGEDVSLLTDGEYQQKLAFVIAGTLLRYVSEGSGAVSDGKNASVVG